MFQSELTRRDAVDHNDDVTLLEPGLVAGRALNDQVWFDDENDGSFAGDIILADDMSEHHPDYWDQAFNLGDGTYPIKIEYRQSSGNAYSKSYLRKWDSDVTVSFKYESGPGVYSDGLQANYYNTDDISADPPPDLTQITGR